MGGPQAVKKGEDMNQLSGALFQDQFRHFEQLIAENSKGHPFTNFQEGLAAVWEGYKPRLRDHARDILAPESWSQDQIGSGAILRRVIDSIEIQDGRANHTNNLVFWQNRYGHANRDHRALLEAEHEPGLCAELEQLLYDLYCGGGNEGGIFDRLSSLTGSKYPLSAYLFFLKDMDRFMPIQPTTFDRAFRRLGIDLVTLRSCSWENYSRFNDALTEVHDALAGMEGLESVRLIDAHSFCWMLEKLDEQSHDVSGAGRTDMGRIIGGREKSVIALRLSVENTVRNSNGQMVEQRIKNKELRMSPSELEHLITTLMEMQDNRCALTGIPFQFHGPDADPSLAPSVDRVDSDGHYEAGNLQIVCRFVNFWKGTTANDEFKQLLMLVRGVEIRD